MNYHNITKDDMLNGEGLRVVLWVAGCNHHCPECQNPETWNTQGGIPFDDKAEEEVFTELRKDYIAGLTLSGGDPLHPNNRNEVLKLCFRIKNRFPDKSIWIYTGYTFEEAYKNNSWIEMFADVLVDGEFKKGLKDVNYPWAGSTNQRVIDIPKSIKEKKVVLWTSKKSKETY